MEHRRACNLCEAICGIVIEAEDNKIISIRGDKDDPFSKGHICPKAIGLKYVYEDPNRLKQPMKRTKTGWRKISLEAAFNEIEKKIKKIRAKYGNDALGIYFGNPSVHNTGTILNSAALAKSLQSKNNFSATSADQLPHHFASWLMLGHQNLFPVPDITRTDFMLILGGNPLASNGSMMTAPDVAHHLRRIQERGGKVVVVDPRKSETAEKASAHHFIKPSTDVYLLLAMIHTLFLENKINLGHLKDFTVGVEVLKNAVEDFPAEKVAPITGLSAETIKQLARDFADAKSAMCYGRMGVSVQSFGGVCQWLVYALNIITGNFDRAGGVMFTTPAFDILAGAKPRNIFGRWHSRVQKRPEFMGELPVSVMSEEILTPGEGQIKAMFTVCGNPVLSTPNGTQLDKAFSGLDFMVSIDIYINETTRHANIILPPATGVEVMQFDATFNTLAIRNTVKYSEPLFEKEKNAKYDWEIMQEIAHRISRTDDSAPKFVSPDVVIDAALQAGSYKLSIEKLKQHPEGIDLGDLLPQLPQRLVHADKKIQLAPEILANDLVRVKSDMEHRKSAIENITINHQPSTINHFTLIGRRHLRDNNSWMHNHDKLMRGHNRCTAMMHPEDAAFLNISDKDIVKISSRVGTVNIPAELTDQIMRGVVSIPHGYGHNRIGTKLDVAEKYAGVSLNDLTDERVIDTLTGNAAFNSVLVGIEKI